MSVPSDRHLLLPSWVTLTDLTIQSLFQLGQPRFNHLRLAVVVLLSRLALHVSMVRCDLPRVHLGDVVVPHTHLQSRDDSLVQVDVTWHVPLLIL